MKILALRFNKLPCFLARIGTSRAGLLFSVGSSLMALQNRVREKNVILTTPNWPKRTWYTNIYPGRQPLASFKQARPAVSSSLLLTCFSATCFNGMAVESQVLKDKWISDFHSTTFCRPSCSQDLAKIWF